MATSVEIERKFLLNENCVDLQDLIQQSLLKGNQYAMWASYASWSKAECDRIRIERNLKTLETQIIRTVKTANSDLSRVENETEMSYEEGLMYLLKCSLPPIHKTRFTIPHHNDSRLTWELDVFHNELTGLAVVEIELPSEDYDFEQPEWLGEEITTDYSYTNVQLYFNREIIKS